jgi:hypothetical protein
VGPVSFWKVILFSKTKKLYYLIKSIYCLVFTDSYYAYACLVQEHCGQIVSITRRFFLGKDESQRSLHLFKRNVVTYPICLGGLGICTSHFFNMILIGKLVWSPLRQKYRILICKYLRQYYICFVGVSTMTFVTWKGILKARDGGKAPLARARPIYFGILGVSLGENRFFF